MNYIVIGSLVTVIIILLLIIWFLWFIIKSASDAYKDVIGKHRG